MPSKGKPQPHSYAQFLTFLEQNPNINFSSTNWNDDEIISEMNWKGLTKQKDSIIKLAQAYQRLQQLLPPEKRELILSLLKENINSAIQIASIPKAKFFDTYASLFGGDIQLLESFYSKAMAVRTRLLLQHMQKVQNSKTSVL